VKRILVLVIAVLGITLSPSASHAASKATVSTTCEGASFSGVGRNRMTEVFITIKGLGRVVTWTAPGKDSWDEDVLTFGPSFVPLAPGDYSWTYGDSLYDGRTYPDHGYEKFTIPACPTTTLPEPTTTVAATTTVADTTTTQAPEPSTSPTEPSTTLSVPVSVTEPRLPQVTEPTLPTSPCAPYNGRPEECPFLTTSPTPIATTTTAVFVPCPEGTDPRLPGCPPLTTTVEVGTAPSVVSTTNAPKGTLPATGSNNTPLIGMGVAFLLVGAFATVGTHRRRAVR